MSRLYYPPLTKSSLARGEREGINGKEYLEKVAKLVPAEILTGYSALISLFLTKSAAEKEWACGAFFVLGIILTPTYLNNMAEPGKPKTVHLVVSTIAFVVWAYFTSAYQVIPQYYDSTWATAALIVFSLVSGAIPLKK
jgi:hypothetical protein